MHLDGTTSPTSYEVLLGFDQQRIDTIGKLASAGKMTDALRLQRCRWQTIHTDTQVSNHCKSRWCPLCENRRTSNLALRLESLIQLAPVRYQPHFFTGTVIDSGTEQIRERVQLACRAFKTFGTTAAMRHCKGWFMVPEITGSTVSPWLENVHIHVVALFTSSHTNQNAYMCQGQIQEHWRRYCNQPDARANMTRIRDLGSTVRYMCKPNFTDFQDMLDNDFNRLVQRRQELRGLRTFHASGILKATSVGQSAQSAEYLN